MHLHILVLSLTFLSTTKSMATSIFDLKAEDIQALTSRRDPKTYYKFCEEAEVHRQKTSKFYPQLQEIALAEHLKSKLPYARLHPRIWQIALLDYDDTLAPSLQPLSQYPEMCAVLVKMLQHGTLLAIVSAQGFSEIALKTEVRPAPQSAGNLTPLPIAADRGLQKNFLLPMQDYLLEHKLPLKLLQQVHFFPSCGTHHYRVKETGEAYLDFSEPDGVPMDLITENLEACQQDLLSEQPTLKNAYHREGYLSLHFLDRKAMDAWVASELGARTKRKAQITARAIPAKDNEPEKFVIHVRPIHVSKAHARNRMLHVVWPQTSTESLDRSRVLVMGDNMHAKDDLFKDYWLMVRGGVNVSLNSEHQGPEESYHLGRCHEGALEFLLKHVP